MRRGVRTEKRKVESGDEGISHAFTPVFSIALNLRLFSNTRELGAIHIAARFKERGMSETHARSRMPGREDDHLHRMVTAMVRLFVGLCIDGLKIMPLITGLLLTNPHQLARFEKLRGHL